MKRSELFFSAILAPLDAIMIFLAFFLAYFLRVRLEFIPVDYVWPLGQYLKFIILILPFWLLIFAINGLYTLRNGQRGWEEINKIFISCSASIALVMVYIFLTRSFFFSRLIIIYAWVLSFVAVAISRYIIRLIQRYLFRYGIGINRVIVLGENAVAQDLIEGISNNKKLGMKIVGLLQIKQRGKKIFQIPGQKILGKIKDLEKVLKTTPSDTLILTENLSANKILQLVNFCELQGIVFKMIPNLFEVKSTNLQVETLSGVPIVEWRHTPLDGWGAIIKRGVDIIGSILFIIVLSPLFLIVSLLIKIDSPGPIIFTQKRLGPEGEFIFLKFRTMYQGAQAKHKLMQKIYGNVFKLKDDPRRTPLGKVLSRWSIDELPQLWNVLRGDMSLIGPRPPMLEEAKNYSPFQRRRLTIRPGITGLWQVSGRSDIPFSQWVKLDIYYIEHWSLWLDFMILLKTFGAVVRKKGAY
jgi:exopolysaccharide biosynthesis polyprenyl glycosylphosphotransferase